jgi:tRNA threonylcarbamoyladenosine biosynthesis protein TsaE
MEKLVIGSESELAEIARKLIERAGESDASKAAVIALSGELGAGKTALVKRIARELGVQDEVTSPTFLIMRRYDTADARFTSLVHIDAYRIEEEGEMAPLRFSEVLAAPQSLVCIEWPERIASLIPSHAQRVAIDIEGEARVISFS